MNRYERYSIVKQKGLSIKKLGQILDRHPGYIGVVIAGRYTSPKLQKEIAKVLDVSPHEFWGDLFRS